MSLPILNRKLVLEAPTRVPDGAGGYVDGWQSLGTLWASVNARPGRETAGPGGTISLSSVTITVRGAPQGSPRRPAPDQRLRDGDRIFKILAVATADPRGRYLACEAREEIST